MKNIDKAVTNAEIGLEVSKFVRDASATIVLAGAVVISGGAAAGVAAGASGATATGAAAGVAAGASGTAATGAAAGLAITGSVLKGTGTYQDTGNAGAAVIEGTVSFITTMIPIGRVTSGGAAAASTAEKLLVVGIDIGNTGVQSVIQNEDAGVNILKQASLAGASEITGDLLDKWAEKNRKIAIPVIAIKSTLLSRAMNASSNNSNQTANLATIKDNYNSCVGNREYCTSLNWLEQAIYPISS